MSALFTRLQNELNSARKAQDKPQTLLLSTIISDAKNKKIELMRDLTDDDVVDVLRKGIKRRRESVEMYDKAGRTELADKERAEIAILQEFLPEQIGEDELRTMVRAAIEETGASSARDLGRVMGVLSPRTRGRADGRTLSGMVAQELAARDLAEHAH